MKVNAAISVEINWGTTDNPKKSDTLRLALEDVFL
jgi:hypothetical protein